MKEQVIIKAQEKEAEELIRQLIRIPSMTGTEAVAKCAEFIAKWFGDNGIPAKIVTYNGVPNVVASLGKNKGKRLLWNGHFDVVPPGDLWTVAPFEGINRDGDVYGRGASDMKGGVAAIMLAMKELKTNGIPFDGEIVFQGIGDEETGSDNGTKALLREYDSAFDAAVSSEPTNFYIERAQRGLRWIEVKVTGKSCHAGRPYVGKNAVEHAVRIITALKAMDFDVSNDLFEYAKPNLSVTLMSGGIKTNVIPESCSFSIDRRMLPGETEDKLVREIDAVLESVKEDGFKVERRVINEGWDPFVTEESEPVFRTVRDSFREIMGTDPGVRGKGGCTDASHIYKMGIPVIILGPGNANESHTSDEKVSVARIARAAEIYASAALKFFSEK